jgi:hypothetical protein
MDSANEVSKKIYANMFAVCEASSSKVQAMLESFPVKFLPSEHIDAVERSVEKVFSIMDRSEDKIQKSLDYLESKVGLIPDLR